MKNSSIIAALVFLVACDGDNKKDSELNKDSHVLKGNWKTGCIYLGAASDQSMVKTINFESDKLTRKSTTYAASTCNGDIVRKHQTVNDITSSSQVLISGYQGVCMKFMKGETAVFHIDGNFVYSTNRTVPAVEGHVAPEVNCSDFNDSDFEISFNNPYTRLP